MEAINPRRLQPAVLARLLNSVGRGEVINERQLRRHRNRAGYTIGDARTVDLFRYAAWLTLEYFKPKDEPLSYDEVKRRQAERNADLVRTAQDIGELPAVVNPERRAAAEASFKVFCETYFPDVFYFAWSPDHLRVVEKIERAVRTGGLFAMAMPRGSGKTVLCQTAVVWAALTGATPFVCLIAASAERARDLLENLMVWLETNPLLGEDFPEVAYPIRCLERITNRQKGQKHHGEPTRIEWTSDKIVLPTIAGSRASGVVISCSGMKGSDIRGQNHARADGRVVRPQLVLVDDPQTTESAWSPSQSERREAILAGDVLGMAGPGKKIAGLMACTVIRPDDMADRMLDREKHPEWQGERTKMAAVRRLCAGKHAEIEAKAIDEGWDEAQTELAVLRASRPTAPAAHIPDNQMTGTILEAACMLSAGLGGVEKQFDEKTLDAADKRFRGGIGLQELLLEAAWANGYTGRNFRDSRAVMRFAFSGSVRDIQAGYSTVDIGGILSNVANKFLLDGFFSVERVWRNICAVRNVSDFKTVTSYRLIGKDQYEQVAPGGELKHGTLGNESYTNKADTYGLILSVDRKDIINDDLNAITQTPRKLGRGSGLKINDVFWTIFLANSAFFTAGNKNYVSGADTVLGIDGLTKGEVAFLDQVDGDGKPTGITPAVLLVPTALSALGTVLQKSLEIRDTTSSTKYPVANPHTGKFRTEVSRYLGNTRYTGASSKAWYLLAEPADLPVIEVAFLNGQESPTIETAEADFSVLGVQMRGYHDFGVALQDPRGGLKSKGEA